MPQDVYGYGTTVAPLCDGLGARKLEMRLPPLGAIPAPRGQEMSCIACGETDDESDAN